MEDNFSRIQALVERPGESLSVEIKRWFDPDKPDGKFLLIKAAFAIRNHGGGYIVLGFDDETLQPDSENIPINTKESFHQDKIQEIITKYASEPFGITVEFPSREGKVYPVITIPPGVKTPVAVRSDLKNTENADKSLVSGSIYVRSLNSNNRVSSTKAGWNDWPAIIEVCFENRETDIGRFLRRHLGNLKSENLNAVAKLILEIAQPLSVESNQSKLTNEEVAQKYSEESEERFCSAIKEKKITLPEFGAWDVSLILLGDIPPYKANDDFLNLLRQNNPNYTGWPIWLISRNFSDKSKQPYIFNKTWEAFLLNLDKAGLHDLDFMRYDPKGRFYLKRMYQDDQAGQSKVPGPCTVLDFCLPIIRSAEAVAVGLTLAKAMGCSPEKTTLAFLFKWNKLNKRELTSWVNPERYISSGQRAYQDEVSSYIEVPLETSLSAVGGIVAQIIQPLFQVFDGFQISSKVVEDLTQRLIERRL